MMPKLTLVELYEEAFKNLKTLASGRIDNIRAEPDMQVQKVDQNDQPLIENYKNYQEAEKEILNRILQKINDLKEKDTDDKLLGVLTGALAYTSAFLNGDILAEEYQIHIKQIDDQKLTNSGLSTGLQVLEGLMFGLAALAITCLLVVPLLIITGTVALPLLPIVVTMASGLIARLAGGFVAAFKSEKTEEQTSVVSSMQELHADFKSNLKAIKADQADDPSADKNPESPNNIVPN